MRTEPNPYAPPQTPTGWRGRPERHPSIELCAACIHHGWISRTVLLSGYLDAEIRYEGGGIGERVFVNDQLAARSSSWGGHWVAPHIDFEIECADSRVAASIDVQVSLLQLFRITRFSLTVDSNVVYTD